MRQAMYALVGLMALMTSTGCCCMDKLWCNHWGLCPWGGGCKTGDCGKGGCATGDCAAGGCATGNCGAGDCQSCGPKGHHLGQHHRMNRQDPSGAAAAGQAAFAGPPTGAVAYPYYTTRGPRDFLANNPPSIGP